MLIITLCIAIIVMLGFAIYGFKNYVEIKKHSIGFKKTKGVCIDSNRFYDPGVGIQDESRGVKSQPYIVYTVENREYEILSQISYGGIVAFFTKGRKFKVLYNPENPYDAILKNSLSFYFQIAVFSVIFIIFLLHVFIPVVYDSMRKDYQYTVFCTIYDSEYKMSSLVIAKSDKEALKEFQKVGITSLTCKNMRLEKKRIK